MADMVLARRGLGRPTQRWRQDFIYEHENIHCYVDFSLFLCHSHAIHTVLHSILQYQTR